jgi:hypothetical protein
MKAHKKSKNAIAGLLAVAGSLTIGGFIIQANAKPPWAEFGSDVLCAFPGNATLSLREIIQTYREDCDQLATDAYVDPLYAVGVVRPVDPCAAGEVGPYSVCRSPNPVPDCMAYFEQKYTVYLNVTSDQVGCFGAGALPLLNVTTP